MIVLSVDSSSLVTTVALLKDEYILGEYTLNFKREHSIILMEKIEMLLKDCEVDINEIDGFVVSKGPGSFTGLRIGAATGKGIAMVTKSSMVAVPTLKAMAYNFYGNTNAIICPIMDARRNHLYTALYRFREDGSLECIIDKLLLSYEELCEKLNNITDKIIFTGDGIEPAKEFFENNLSCNYEYAPAHLRTQKAGSVAMAGLDMYKNGEVIDAAQLKPDYLRPSQAERERMDKHE